MLTPLLTGRIVAHLGKALLVEPHVAKSVVNLNSPPLVTMLNGYKPKREQDE